MYRQRIPKEGGTCTCLAFVSYLCTDTEGGKREASRGEFVSVYKHAMSRRMKSFSRRPSYGFSSLGRVPAVAAAVTNRERRIPTTAWTGSRRLHLSWWIYVLDILESYRAHRCVFSRAVRSTRRKQVRSSAERVSRSGDIRLVPTRL